MSGIVQGIAVTQRIAAATRANVHTVNSNKRPNESYESEWKRFQAFVDERRLENKLQPEEKYLTRDNVDLYFGEKVAYREVTPDSARRVVSSLQWFADHREHHEASFPVDSPHVKQALKAHRERFTLVVAKRVQDPHFQLPTSVLTKSEHEKASHAILERPEWEDLHFSWNLNDTTFIRMGSWLKLKLSDIKTDEAHGPPNDTGPGMKRMLSYVLRPGGVHKDRHKYSKVVGNWRHKDYFRCATGSIAMGLMVRARYDPNLIYLNFYKNTDPQVRPDWWDVPLSNRWNGTNAANSAYRSLLEETKISWSKVMHLRKDGMDKAGTVGVSEAATGSMSKHTNGKITRYVPQLCHEVMHVMADFLPRVEYYVPRTLLVLPWSGHDVVRAIFIRYDEWIAQHNSPQGDHSDAAKDFLFVTLPFLALVALQDGIYWIRDHPNNSASVMLRNSFRDYERWAAEARKQVVAQQATLEESRVELLDAAAQASYNALGRKMELLTEEIRQKTQLLTGLAEENRQQILLLQQQVTAQQQSPFASSSISMVPTHRNPIQVSTTNALTLLRPSPRVPGIPSDRPKRIIDILLQHNQFKLEEYKNDKQTHWGNALRSNYSRRMYLYRQIEFRARHFQATDFEERMRQAAFAMDQERGELTVSKFHDALKKKDPSTKQRNRNRNCNAAAN